RLEALAQFLQLGWDHGEAIGVPLTLVRPIILVIGFGWPPVAHRFDRGDDPASLLLIGPGNRFARLAVLLVALREDRRAVLSANVVALTIELRRVVRGEEDVEQVVVTQLLRVEGDADRLGMVGVAAADLLVGRTGDVAARI